MVEGAGARPRDPVGEKRLAALGAPKISHIGASRGYPVRAAAVRLTASATALFPKVPPPGATDSENSAEAGKKVPCLCSRGPFVAGGSALGLHSAYARRNRRCRRRLRPGPQCAVPRV